MIGTEWQNLALSAEECFGPRLCNGASKPKPQTGPPRKGPVLQAEIYSVSLLLTSSMEEKKLPWEKNCYKP